MALERFRFNRIELAGSLGDIGTLIPLAVGLIVINGLSSSAVLLMVGVFYILAGWYFHLPVPVQPLKVVSAIAIALGPGVVSPPVIAASAFLFGGILILISVTGVVDLLGRLFTKPIVRGIQLGLGLILIIKALVLITLPEIFITPGEILPRFVQDIALSWNLLFGLVAFLLVLLLINSTRYPAALVVIAIGIAIGVGSGGLSGAPLALGPTELEIFTPTPGQLWSALILLVIPQLPLTVGNAIISTRDTAANLFGREKTRRVTLKSLGTSMGLTNLAVGALGAMPMCHGAGGLAAHYRFGARTGGSNLMIGAFFVVLALVLGKLSIALLTSIPAAVLGVLLLFAGIELSVLIKDLEKPRDLFISLLIAGIALATTNMSYAFVIGIVVKLLMDKARISF